MPFESKAQQRKCYALKARGEAGSWDCTEWSHATDFDEIPDKKKKRKEAKAMDAIAGLAKEAAAGAMIPKATSALAGRASRALVPQAAATAKKGLPWGKIGLGAGALGAGLGGAAALSGNQDASRGTTSKPPTGQGITAKPAAPAQAAPAPAAKPAGGGGGVLQWIMANPGKASLLGLAGGGIGYGLYRLLRGRRGRDEEKEGKDHLLKRASDIKQHNAAVILDRHLIKMADDASPALAKSFNAVRSRLAAGESISTAMHRAFPKMAAERRTILSGRLCKQAMAHFVKEAFKDLTPTDVAATGAAGYGGARLGEGLGKQVGASTAKSEASGGFREMLKKVRGAKEKSVGEFSKATGPWWNTQRAFGNTRVQPGEGNYHPFARGTGETYQGVSRSPHRVMPGGSRTKNLAEEFVQNRRAVGKNTVKSLRAKRLAAGLQGGRIGGKWGKGIGAALGILLPLILGKHRSATMKKQPQAATQAKAACDRYFALCQRAGIPRAQIKQAVDQFVKQATWPSCKHNKKKSFSGKPKEATNWMKQNS